MRHLLPLLLLYEAAASGVPPNHGDKDKDEEVRIIQDLRRSGVNDRCQVPERLVLPRMHDAAADGMALTRAVASRKRKRAPGWHRWPRPSTSEVGVEGGGYRYLRRLQTGGRGAARTPLSGGGDL